MKAVPNAILWALLIALSPRIVAAADQVTTSYIQAIAASINAAVHRPNVEMRPNETGTVTVSFDCMDNVISDLKIDRSSRERAFDRAAFDAVRSAKLPAVPSELAHKTIHVSVEVRIPAAS